MQLAPGTIVDNKFRIIAHIGVGGMGSVFSAEQMELNRKVALKVLAGTGPLDEESAARFLQEAQIISKLHHRNIVSIYAFGQWQNTPYIAMEFVTGNSLQSLLQDNQPLDVRFVLETGIQICSALSHAHKHGIVHRDLKPANIMLGSNGDVTVIDFGFAKILQADAARRQQQLTEAGCTVGSILYMSPEQCQGQPVDGRTDVYGLGCVLYHCLTGHPPFNGDHSVSIMFQHVNDQAPRLVGAPTELDSLAELQRILDMAMAKDLVSRYQFADEMLHDLSLAAANVTPLNLHAGSPSSTAFSQIPDQNHVKKVIAPRFILPLIMVFCILIAFALFQVSPLTKSHQAARDDDPTGGNLNPYRYVRLLDSLKGIERLEYLTKNRKRINNFSGREVKDRTYLQHAITDLSTDGARLVKRAKVSEAFKLLLRGEESLLALPQNTLTNDGRLAFWEAALRCQSILPVSQRSQDIAALTEQYIGDCTVGNRDEVRCLLGCIGLLDQLGYPDDAFKLCRKAARYLEELKMKNAVDMLESVHLAFQVGRWSRQYPHNDIERRMVAAVRRWTETTTDAAVLYELFHWEPQEDFPNHDELILRALKITDPHSIKSVELNVTQITSYRVRGKLELAERLAAKTLASLVKLSTSRLTADRKVELEKALYYELSEAKLQRKKPAVEILAVLNRLPPTNNPTELLSRSLYYTRTYVLERKYAKAQEIIDAALRHKSQPKSEDQSEYLCNVLVYAGFFAHKRGDQSRAEDYWQSAKSVASEIDIYNPGRLAQWQQVIDDYRKTRTEPELFK